jgi:hypothetical protein
MTEAGFGLSPRLPVRKAIMGFLKKLFSSTPVQPERRYYVFQVKCNRCGEIIEGRLDLDNDLSIEFEGDRTIYFVRKGLMGQNRCFQQIEVEMKFTSSRELIEQETKGGTFVE